MKSILQLSFVIIFSSSFLLAQEITFIPRQTAVNDTAGDEVIIYIDLVNVSQAEQTVFVLRTLNQLPPNWTTSLCFDFCYPDWVDSIATTSTFGSSPLLPGEMREVSVHFFTDNIPNSGLVELQAGTFRSPDQRITVELQASTFDPTSVENDFDQVNNFTLEQNYPNPFNPSTKIRFVIPNEVRNLKNFSSLAPRNDNSFVILKVYDVLGNEVATLVNENKPAGSYEVLFDASKNNLPSGVYFYQLRAGSFTQTKLMLLEK
ncbi:T9SS type A sorting domain-containing protein [Ignavibacterium sp.]|uniref:T9SS type A sorting domain-containing protein n=1 Tax=Ignavibacterium sp. TaxID=2651167 RepID=UPI00307E9A01